MRRAWRRLGRQGRLAIAVAAIVAAFAALLLAVLGELGDEPGAGVAGDTRAELIAFFFAAAALTVGAVLLAAYRVEEAFARQRRFVSDASHELRTPLTAIRGQLEVLALEERPTAAEVRRVEGIVGREMGRIERLVEDLLTLARLDEGAPLHRRPLDLGPYLRELAEAEPGVALGRVPTGTLDADPDRLAQVLRNLLANARRHAGPGGRVELSATARDGRLAIRVDDDGPGIPAAERRRVFDRFHRSEAARDRDSGGSGLGLPIARSIVERHGGELRVEDSPLGGARLRIDLGGFGADEKPLT